MHHTSQLARPATLVWDRLFMCFGWVGVGAHPKQAESLSQATETQ